MNQAMTIEPSSTTDLINLNNLKRYFRLKIPSIGVNEGSRNLILNGFDKGENWLSLQKAFVKDGWDEEDSKGTDARCKTIAMDLAEFLDNNKIPEGFAYPLRDGGIGFSWSPGRTKKLFLIAEIELEDGVLDYYLNASIDEIEIINECFSDYNLFAKRIYEIFSEKMEIK